MIARCLTLVVLIGSTLTVTNPGASWASEGFGTIFNRDFATVNRSHPPRVFIRGSRIAVQGIGQTAEQKAAAERLRSLLESEVLGADKRLRLEPNRPETLIEVEVVETRGSESWETRTVTKRQDTGQKDAKGKPIYRDTEEQVRFKVVRHTFSLAYRVQDTRTKENLEADTLNTKYSQEFQEGRGAPDLPSLEAAAITSSVEAIRSRLTPSTEQMGVLLPRGSLKGLNNLATAGLWSQYAEAVQSLPPRAKPEDEAYRQYAMGLAYEAQGYAAESVSDTLRFLQQASAYYTQALQANPGEKYFSLPYDRKSFRASGLLKVGPGGMLESQTYPAPLDRVKRGLVDYQRFKEFLEVQEEAGGKAVVGTPTPGAPGPAVEAMTNASVIEMVKAGLAEEIILTAIDNAANSGFDASPKGLIELGKAKVSKAIIQRIQSKVGTP